MAHFAQLDENNQVIGVIVVNNDVITLDGVEDEQAGIDFCRSLYGAETNWRQTSYNASFRKNYAGLGFTYDATRDAFIPPKPYASWSLDEDLCQWQPPVSYPESGRCYWDEAQGTWVEII